MLVLRCVDLAPTEGLLLSVAHAVFASKGPKKHSEAHFPEIISGCLNMV